MKKADRRVASVLIPAVLAVFLVCLGCTPSSRPGSPDTSPVALRLYCGAGLRPAADALIRAFESREAVKINATFAGSGLLLSQIAAHRSGDLFLPGADFYIEKAAEKGLVADDAARVVAYFVPVISVRKGNPQGIKTLLDLTGEGLRLGLGDERCCAVGVTALEIFEKNGIPFSDVAGNLVLRSGTVNELAVAVQLGSIDATIIWDATARQFSDDSDMVGIPLEENAVTTVSIARLASSRHPEVAERFIDFVTSDEGRRILTEQGYTVSLTEDVSHQ